LTLQALTKGKLLISCYRNLHYSICQDSSKTECPSTVSIQTRYHTLFRASSQCIYRTLVFISSQTCLSPSTGYLFRFFRTKIEYAIITYITTSSHTIIRYNTKDCTKPPTCFRVRSHHPQGRLKEHIKIRIKQTSLVGKK
jgi:hypothetical protein